QYSIPSSRLVLNWLRQNPKAGPWARTLQVDYLIKLGNYLGCLEEAWLDDSFLEPLVSGRPLIEGAECFEKKAPEKALAYARKSRGIDPYNAKAWQIELRLLKTLGRVKELAALEK